MQVSMLSIFAKNHCERSFTTSEPSFTSSERSTGRSQDSPSTNTETASPACTRRLNGTVHSLPMPNDSSSRRESRVSSRRPGVRGPPGMDIERESKATLTGQHVVRGVADSACCSDLFTVACCFEKVRQASVRKIPTDKTYNLPKTKKTTTTSPH